jgi:hypothetical protein
VVAPAPAHMHERLRACGWNAEEFVIARAESQPP